MGTSGESWVTLQRVARYTTGGFVARRFSQKYTCRNEHEVVDAMADLSQAELLRIIQDAAERKAVSVRTWPY